jgi:serine/threonine protein kinase
MAEQAEAPSEKDDDTLIGRVVGGRFRILSRIARGGMGKVYKAEQAPLGRVCALKVLSPNYDGDGNPEFAKRFVLEAATAAKLSHPNTVTIFDYGQDGDLYYIAMEYIEGRTLYRALREVGGPLPEARALRIASQICRSLREAHSLGLVHRDLKPGNILISDHGDERDVVKVLDFGLVKDITGSNEDLTQQGMFMGSPKYMAPEQVTGDEITQHTDIYSLGVLMFEMLTGRVPFEGTGMATLMAHVNATPAKVTDLNPKASQAVDDIIQRCLKKDPAQRFASMKEVLHAIKLASGDDAILVETSESMPATRIPAGLLGNDAPTVQSTSQPSGSGIRPNDLRRSGDSLVGQSGAADVDLALQPKKRLPAWVFALAVGVGVGVTALVLSQRGEPKADPAAPTPATTNQPAADTSAAPSSEATGAPSGSPSASSEPIVPGQKMRAVRVESDPSGASVHFDGSEKCRATPCEVVLRGEDASRKVTLTLKKAGYKSYALEVGAKDETAKGTLSAIPFNPPPTAPPTATGYKKSPYD